MQHRQHEQKAKNTNGCGPNCVHRPWRISLSDRERFLLPGPKSWDSYIGKLRSDWPNSVRRVDAVVHAWRDIRRVVFPVAKRPNGSPSEMRSTPRLSLRGRTS